MTDSFPWSAFAMTSQSTPAERIDAYIASFPLATQKLLKQLRAAIRDAAPNASETIAYGIPTFKLDGNLVHFAAYKNHIGFYPAPSGLAAFKKELAKYKGAKGSVQFPVTGALPIATIKKIVKFRVKENMEKAGSGNQQFLAMLGGPARRALENAGIKTLKQLARLSLADVQGLDGMGQVQSQNSKKSLRNLLWILKDERLKFAELNLSVKCWPSPTTTRLRTVLAAYPHTQLKSF